MVVRSQHFQLIETSYVGVGAETDLLIWKLKAGYFQKCIHTYTVYAYMYICMYRLISKFECVWQHQRPKTTAQIPGKVPF